MRAEDWPEATRRLDATLAEGGLGPAGTALAHWYRAAARARLGDRDGELGDLRAFLENLPRDLVPAGTVGADLLHRRSLAELAVLADDAGSDPSVGRSPEEAVPVLLARDEYFYVSRLACGPDRSGEYSVEAQSLLESGAASLDRLDLRCGADGSALIVYFDIGDWMMLLNYALSGGGPLPQGLDAEGAASLLEQALSP